ncbi:MAG: hypothetical protein LUG94_00800 [Ruminococcus sp.]|nr:hypothetical protein [Ruminococcus sp.]
MELLCNNILRCSLFKGRRVSIFGCFKYIKIDDIIRIIEISGGEYLKSAFSNEIDYLILSNETYERCSKKLFKQYQDIDFLYRNITSNNISVVSEDEFLNICGVRLSENFFPQYFGKQILYPVSEYVVVDIICTGYDYHLDEIFQISAIKVKDNCIIERFVIDIKPMDYNNNYMTSITRGDIKDSLIRYTIEEAVIRYAQFIGDLPIVTNDAFIKNNLIFHLYYNATFKCMCNDYIDILYLSKNIFYRIKKMNFETLSNKLNIHLDYNCKGAMLWCENICTCYELLKKKSKFKEVPNLSINALNNKIFVLEGVFETISRNSIIDFIELCGAKVYNNVVKSVDFLLLSNSAYCEYVNGRKSKKQVLAENFIMEGNNILIISENIFNDIMSYGKLNYDSINDY